MRAAVLLGNRDTRRSAYFEKAARQIGLPFRLLEWDMWREYGFPGKEQYVVKIDPPVWRSCRLSELNHMVDGYREELKELDRCASISRFLNSPDHILALLDKGACKHMLGSAGLPVTEELGEGILNSSLLLSRMQKRRIFQVFLKPLTGSGAAGVTAFRFQPSTGRMAAYSCALLDDSADTPQVINTKRLRVFTEPEEIFPLLDGLLSVGCIVERWYPKEEYHGFSYDLRAVYQEGKLDFLLARLSKGPITNLHLNNQPLEAGALGLSESIMASIEELCAGAMECYPGLSSAGIDILLEKGSMKPRIIEMNGQGDLLYQDIYQNNRIYGHQTELMKAWLSN